MEDAAEADGVLEEAVDVEHGAVGAGVGDVVDVRDHLLAHPRCAAGDRPSLVPERMTDRARLLSDDFSALRFRFLTLPAFFRWFWFCSQFLVDLLPDKERKTVYSIQETINLANY